MNYNDFEYNNYIHLKLVVDKVHNKCEKQVVAGLEDKNHDVKDPVDFPWKKRESIKILNKFKCGYKASETTIYNIPPTSNTVFQQYLNTWFTFVMDWEKKSFRSWD